MEKPVLSDKSKTPTDEVVFSHIGKAKPLWLAFFAHVEKAHPDIQKEWRYYNDGKSWLMKATRKTRTVFWLSISAGGFRTTFYFGGKAEPTILASAIPDELKEQYTKGRRFGRIRAVTVVIRNKKDVENAGKMIPLKLACK
jgi:hypothetical protein